MFNLDSEVERDIEAATQSGVNVLITGGDASTRRLVAERIHQGSCCSSGALAVVSCDEDWDVKSYPISPPHRTTMFIEGIDKLNECQQTALLAMLDPRIVAASPKSPAWRIISASDSPLYHRVTQGQFQADLFYRLNVIHVAMPR